MTSEDLIRDVEKFVEYLNANGNRALSVLVHCEGATGKIHVAGYGTKESHQELLCAVLADQLGLKVVPK